MTAENPAVAALFRYFELWNSFDLHAVMAVFTDDIDIVGLGGCPCRGKQEVRERFVERTLKSGFKLIGPNPIALAPDRARTPWGASIELDGDVRVVRGFMEVAVRGSQIRLMRAAYDLTDPQTIVARTLMGDSVFALDAPGTLKAAPWRAIIIDIRDGARVSVIHDRMSPGADGSRVEIRSEQDPSVVHALSPVDHGQSVTLVGVTLAELCASPHHLVVSGADGSTIASAVIPRPAPIGEGSTA